MQNFHEISPELLETSLKTYLKYSKCFVIPTDFTQNFYILCQNFRNNYYIHKIYSTISTDQNCPGMFIRMNIGKYVLATLIRTASSPFGVFQEND